MPQITRDLFAAGALVAVLAHAPGARAETKTYCDNKCGDSQQCKYTCCHITTTPIEGVDIITKISCSSSTCCAHPKGSISGGVMQLPADLITGISAPIKLGLTAVADLDASAIAVDSDEERRKVTLSGVVKAASQRDQAEAVAKRNAKGYEVVNQLTIARCP